MSSSALRLGRKPSKFGMWAIQILFLTLGCTSRVSAQGLILAPPTVTRELGAYYLSKLGLAEKSLDYYSILSQRNIKGANVYTQINNVSNTMKPIEAAATISGIRGLYTANGIGGKVTVEIFYKLFRCEDDPDCFTLSRVVASEYASPSGPMELLTYLKTTMGASGATVNAPQQNVNPVLGQPNSERAYLDDTYKTHLFYKVATPPPPCSSAEPSTYVGSLSEYEKLPDYGCVNYQGTPVMIATTSNLMLKFIRANAIDWSFCDGSLQLLYLTGSTGPKLTQVIRNPGEVPFTVRMNLPGGNTLDCYQLYGDLSLTLEALTIFGGLTFTTSDGPLAPIPADILALGFNGTCEPPYFAGSYGYLSSGQSEDIMDGIDDPAFASKLIPFNASGTCISMLGVNQPASGIRDSTEDSCAQLYFGNADQQREGIVTNYGYDADFPAANVTTSLKDTFRTGCDSSYLFSVSNVLSQIAIDFEAEKNFLLSASEVKLHLDSVAANAASVLAVEVALASSGIVVARTIARSGLYRRRRISSSAARSLAVVTTAVGITLFNIPNFALISKSLHNHKLISTFTEASVNEYRPSNFSAVLKAETHAFVTVQGSSATAIIGLLFYSATLILCLYLTWSEFTEIIRRRDEAASRLGHEALIADKDLLIQWRGTDSLLHDTLHPKAVVESGLQAEIELMRRQLAKNRAEASPRGKQTGQSDAQPLHSGDLYREDSSDLYPV